MKAEGNSSRKRKGNFAMKIAWFCIPAHGHTNPTLGVVKELTGAGHEVYYFSFDMLRGKIERAGAVFISCDGFDFDIQDKNAADRVGKDIAFATELLVKATLALDGDDFRKGKGNQTGSDCVGFYRLWGKLTAMKYGIPYDFFDHDFRVQPVFVKISETRGGKLSNDFHHAKDKQIFAAAPR